MYPTGASSPKLYGVSTDSQEKQSPDPSSVLCQKSKIMMYNTCG